jgi:hypothetical protein
MEQEEEDNNLHFNLVSSLHNKISFFPNARQEGNHANSVHLYCTNQHSSTVFRLLHKYRK